jgi:hypothetical protein
MGRSLLRAVAGIACALLTACVQPSDPSDEPSQFQAQLVQGMSWEWQSKGAFRRIAVLTLYQNRTALYETWGPLDSSDAQAASYRSETGRVQWEAWDNVVVFDNGEQASLRIKTDKDGTLSAWWLPANDLDAPDMTMRPTPGHAKGIRPIDLP